MFILVHLATKWQTDVVERLRTQISSHLITPSVSPSTRLHLPPSILAYSLHVHTLLTAVQVNITKGFYNAPALWSMNTWGAWDYNVSDVTFDNVHFIATRAADSIFLR